MGYKILYIEDLEAESLKMDIEQLGIQVDNLKPESFEQTFSIMNSKEYDAILLDFKLDEETSNNILFNAPSLAQNLRTKNIDEKSYRPIFLITNQQNISAYYKDFSSHDLFDFVKTKVEFRNDLSKMCIRIKAFIDAYRTIVEKKHDINSIFNANKIQSSYIDYRIIETLSRENYNDNVNKIAFYIYHKIIRSYNFLVGEDILLARLGVQKQSPQWDDLLRELQQFKYSGIYSVSHDRWWWNDIEKWWSERSKGVNLRRLKAADRCELIKQFTGLTGLIAAEKNEHSKSEYFWTICTEKLFPIDPMDGLELMKKELLPWQESEYLSMQAALESSEKNKFLHKADFDKMIAYSKTL